MIIRLATENDLKQVADVHIECFPNSFSTQLGKHKNGWLQQQFYKEYLTDVPELFFVAEEDKKIVGFCMGYFCEKNDYVKKYFKNNLFNIAIRTFILLISFNEVAWSKIINMFSKKVQFKTITEEFNQISTEEKADLLSICVLPEYRGQGVAQSLIEEFQKKSVECERKLCILTVSTNNGRGIRFYERNGFEKYKEAGKVAITFAKKL